MTTTTRPTRPVTVRDMDAELYQQARMVALSRRETIQHVLLRIIEDGLRAYIAEAVRGR